MTLHIATANRLRDGAVVYFTAESGWSHWIADARVSNDEQSAQALLDQTSASVDGNEVVEPYLIEVLAEARSFKPVRYREIIRAKGPSSHPQYGRDTIDAATASHAGPVAMAHLNGI